MCSGDRNNASHLPVTIGGEVRKNVRDPRVLNLRISRTAKYSLVVVLQANDPILRVRCKSALLGYEAFMY